MKTVFVGLSGGVDSSVAALLLQRQGYHVVGVYMKNWTSDVAGRPCPWKADLTDAQAVAAGLGIELRIFDFQEEYRDKVVRVMVDEYAAGRTPNPDILCNQEIKFKLFLETCIQAGADFVATGHYARTESGQLLQAVDKAKDQTYFLYRVERSALERTLFPVGEFHKSEIRKMAESAGLVTATKPDSQGICFIGEVGIKPFLQQYIQGEPGPIRLRSTGITLGQHDGIIFYTIGQRHGLGIGGGQPLYVVDKDPMTDTLWVTDDPEDLELNTSEFSLTDCHWIDTVPQADNTYGVRLRHRGSIIEGKLSQIDDGYTVKLSQSERGVAPGQSAVIYEGERVLGGGIITK